MSETLYVEGPDEQALRRRVEAEHGPGARIVSVSHPRRGGVLGFFSREYVGLTVEVPAVGVPAVEVATVEPHRVGAEAPVAVDSLLELIDRADRSDGPPAEPPVTLGTERDFAQLLAQFAVVDAEPDAEPEQVARVEPDLPPPPMVRAWPTIAPAYREPAPTAPPGAPTSARLELLAELRELGVPVAMSGATGAGTTYGAIEQIVDQLPSPPQPPRRAGELLVLAGPLEITRRLARTLAVALHVPDRGVWIAGATDDEVQTISGPRNAGRRAAEIKAGDEPAIVVVATDVPDLHGDPRPSWPAQVIAALDPTAVWAVVDATRKSADARAELARLGPLHALAVHSADRTTSPASVWDLDVPVALIDGRPATAGTWAALLFDALRANATAAIGR